MVEVINDYMNYLIARGLSKLTIKTYKIDLDQLLKFLKSQFQFSSFNSVSRSTLRFFISWLNQNNLSNRTISRKISTMREFFKFCFRNDHIQKNPTEKLIYPKFSIKLPNFFTIKEMFDLIDLPDLSTKYGIRNKAILEVLYSTGMRISEITNVVFADLDLDSLQIKVFGKGNKDRIVPLGRMAIKAVSNYLKIRKEFIIEENVFIFVSRFGTQFSPNSLREVLNIYIKKIAKTDGYSVHSIRHSFATHMLERGAHLSTIQKILGHENLTTTEIYTQLSLIYVRKSYDKYHPINTSQRDQMKLAFFDQAN